MAADFTVKSQNYERVADDAGHYYPAVVVHFETNDTPPQHGKVAVPESAMSDPASFAQMVKEKIETAIAAHRAVAAL